MLMPHDFLLLCGTPQDRDVNGKALGTKGSLFSWDFLSSQPKMTLQPLGASLWHNYTDIRFATRAFNHKLWQPSVTSPQGHMTFLTQWPLWGQNSRVTGTNEVWEVVIIINSPKRRMLLSREAWTSRLEVSRSRLIRLPKPHKKCGRVKVTHIFHFLNYWDAFNKVTE